MPYASFGTAASFAARDITPSLIAQYFSMLSQLYPDRIILGLGTERAIKEIPLGYSFLGFRESHVGLEKSPKIIRGLWEGNALPSSAEYYPMEKTRLYTRLSQPIPIYVAATGAKSAEPAARYADCLVAVSEDGPLESRYMVSG